MADIRLLRPERRRQTPRTFSWVDHRLIRENHIQRCSAQAWALYLVLLTVGNGQGISYYSDRRLCQLLNFAAVELKRVRQELINADLIAHEPPIYQVLSLDLSPEIPAKETTATDPTSDDAQHATPEQIDAIIDTWKQGAN